MKSTLYLLAALFMLLASCSKDDDKDQPIEPPYKIPLHDWNLTLEQVDQMMKADPTNPKGEIIMGPKKYLVTHYKTIEAYAIWKSDSVEYVFYPDNKLCAAKLKMGINKGGAITDYAKYAFSKTDESNFRYAYYQEKETPGQNYRWSYGCDFYYLDEFNFIKEWDFTFQTIEVTYANPKYIEMWDKVNPPIRELTDEQKSL